MSLLGMKSSNMTDSRVGDIRKSSDSTYTGHEAADGGTDVAARSRIPVDYGVRVSPEYVRATLADIQRHETERVRLVSVQPNPHYRVTFLEALQRGARRRKN